MHIQNQEQHIYINKDTQTQVIYQRSVTIVNGKSQSQYQPPIATPNGVEIPNQDYKTQCQSILTMETRTITYVRTLQGIPSP